MWDAWEMVGKRLRKAPDELRARLARRRSLMYRRPLRAFCLAVRAGDLRITPWRAAIVPEHAMKKRAHGGRMIAHQVRLDARRLRELCAPVRIEPAREPLFNVAKRLGCRHSALQAMRRNGSLPVRYFKMAWRRGKATPMVYTPHALDPGAYAKERPDPIWRHLWELHAESTAVSLAHLAGLLRPIISPIRKAFHADNASGQG